MKSLKLTVKGRVQRAGYRNFVDETAYALGIRGQVKNLEDGSVEIIAQHEDKQTLEKFIERLNVSEYPIHVKEIAREEVESEPFEEFDIKRGDLAKEQSERLDEAAFYLRQVSTKIDSFSSNTSFRFDTVDHKYGKISDKLEEISISLNKLVSVLERFAPEK
jgi:acylphosphatase